ncbi:outer membrane protein assembly factor BamA [Pseudokordiimonas caeni]|uniref:outer membrane protein assembly factor BamA n=1 Tax=Pseudokordiimonas caeni TaxID=2997908 RepID=UPI0028111CF8|nr:outer membrane protein assembly factor BamA [Pseudokordiimonas caeni]
MTPRVLAQDAAQIAQQVPVIRQISVIGSERVEAETVASYLTVKTGDRFEAGKLDESLKNLFATGLFSDVELSQQNGVLIVRVVENPIINRIVFEGNKRLDNDKLIEEVRLRPRMVFTRAKVRSDVQRMMELYRRSGRFAAIIEPKVVQLDQNRVDLIFEVQEGPKTKVSRVNFIGNHKYSDGDLRDVMATKEARWWKIFTSNDTFDPDRLAYDQQQLRQHYLNEGYADFRVASAVSELTPDREDFFITFTLEEGELYHFGKINVVSEIRDVDARLFEAFLLMREGDIYSAKRIEDTIEALTNAAGLLGYAFVDIQPQVDRDREGRIINITFTVKDAPRVYVERINIHGNVRTLDKVIRREFRLQEGDAFNSALVTRSESRLDRLSFFREVEVEKTQGSEPDRMVLDVKVEEQATGELNLGAGFSSLENFIFDFSIRERNLAGRGQDLSLGLRLSGYTQQATLSFTEPYFMGRNVAAGGDLFITRTEPGIYNTAYSSLSRGFSLRAGMAISEFWTLSTRYTLRYDTVKPVDSYIQSYFDYSVSSLQTRIENDDAAAPILLDRYDLNRDGKIDATDFDLNGDGALSQDEQLDVFPQYYRESFGSYWQSIIGYTVGFDTRNNLIRPTRGHSFYFSQDFAGLGGNVRYLKTRVNFDNYWTPWEGWTFRIGGESGFVEGIGENVRFSDKFYIGGPRIRGFDAGGIGPRRFAQATNTRSEGGTAYYIGRGELFFPLGDAALEMGINASAFVDVGSLWRGQLDGEKCGFSLKEYNDYIDLGDPDVDFPYNLDCIAGDSPSPRVAVGIGFSWQSPFGPFRIDLAKTLRKQLGDQTQTLQFNVGTTF